MKRVGTKSEVYFGHAKETAKGIRKEHLTLSPKGNIILITSLKKTQGAGFFNNFKKGLLLQK
jgi:hypothetical protein